MLHSLESLVNVVKRGKLSCLSVVCRRFRDQRGLVCILSAMNALLCLTGRHIHELCFEAVGPRHLPLSFQSTRALV